MYSKAWLYLQSTIWAQSYASLIRDNARDLQHQATCQEYPALNAAAEQIVIAATQLARDLDLIQEYQQQALGLSNRLDRLNEETKTITLERLRALHQKP